MSNSKSKTPRTLKSTSKKSTAAPVEGLHEAIADAAAAGYRPATALSPQDEQVFRAFQANLLSLISHELRTPLTGVLNALMMLEEGTESPGFNQKEIVSMARHNAQRLHRTLVTLLDYAALESGTFHARLREVDLVRLIRARAEAQQPWLQDSGIALRIENESEESFVLADPQKLSRAVDLCLEVVAARGARDSELEARVAGSVVELAFALAEGGEPGWQKAWSQALAGYEGGVASPASAFGGVLQSEREFLTRSEEGLGSELLLIHQILRLHHAEFSASQERRKVRLRLQFPELSSEAGLTAVLTSRAYRVSNELGTVALALIEAPAEADIREFSLDIKRKLFRPTDAVYSLPEKRQVALVLDDCRGEDALRVMRRLERELGRSLRFGVAHCPEDGLDPARLPEVAAGRLGSGSK